MSSPSSRMAKQPTPLANAVALTTVAVEEGAAARSPRRRRSSVPPEIHEAFSKPPSRSSAVRKWPPARTMRPSARVTERLTA